VGHHPEHKVLTVVTGLTLLSVITQIIFFIIHSQATALVYQLVQSAIATHLFHSVIIFPLLKFMIIQIIAYILFIFFIIFLTEGCSRLFSLPFYPLSIFFWIMGFSTILGLNSYYFPHSFFAYHPFIKLLWVSLPILLLALLAAYYQCLRYREHLVLGCLFLSISMLAIWPSIPFHSMNSSTRPNIIIIGLDSLRPDFTGYFGHPTIHTPTINHFLETAVTFTESYTPLARTFPAWISILTGKYPKNNHAQTNLPSQNIIKKNNTLAKELKKMGYETFYATDEKRFSNITEDYGFDHIIGPKAGLNDFILGSLSDFPLTNLLINLPLGEFLFPFNYGNRAASITYQPKAFLHLIKKSLASRSSQPLFLAIHLCTSHWPFTWSNDHQTDNLTLDARYYLSVEEVDKQLNELLALLEKENLLKNSLVVLLSDHGTTLGLPHERVIDKRYYEGDPKKLKQITLYKFNTAPHFSVDFKHDYGLDTSYGQGTDILSLKQYHVLLAFKGFGLPLTPKVSSFRSSLIDIMPTVLAFLHKPPIESDGLSLFNLKAHVSRPLYLETDFRIPAIETSEISVGNVLKQSLHFYELDPKNGYLYVNSTAEKLGAVKKQRAVLKDNWLIADINDANPPYKVIVNLKTKRWRIM